MSEGPTPDPATADAFAGEVRAILNDSAPAFDLKAVAELARSRGLLSAQEADRLVLYSDLPDWLSARLDDGRARPDTAVQMTKLTRRTACSLRAPRGPGASEGLLATLAPGQAHAPAIRRLEGGRSVHHVANYRQIAWAGDHVLADMSAPRGRTFLPFLETATPEPLPGHVFLGVVEGASIYVHWMLDTLPRMLLLLEDDPAALDRFEVFLFAAANASFHRQALDRLGIDPGRVRTRERHGTLFSVEAFTHVTAPRQGCVTHGRVYDAVAGLFLPDTAPPAQTRRLHISRDRTAYRRILNEPELCAVLDRHGFETLYLEEISITEAAEAMRAASHVIAPHGAGLANLIFAQPGTRVMELFSTHLSRDYWVICNQRGLSYTGFQAWGPEGRPVSDMERQRMTFFQRNRGDLIVPMEAFQTVFEQDFLSG